MVKKEEDLPTPVIEERPIIAGVPLPSAYANAAAMAVEAAEREERAARERYKVEQAAKLERALLEQAQAAAMEGSSSRPKSPEPPKSPTTPPAAEDEYGHEEFEEEEEEGAVALSGGLDKLERPSEQTHTALHQREAAALSPRALQAIYHKNLLAELSWLPDKWEQAVRATVKEQGREVQSPSKKKWRAARQTTQNLTALVE